MPAQPPAPSPQPSARLRCAPPHTSYTRRGSCVNPRDKPLHPDNQFISLSSALQPDNPGRPRRTAGGFAPLAQPPRPNLPALLPPSDPAAGAAEPPGQGAAVGGQHPAPAPGLAAGADFWLFGRVPSALPAPAPGGAPRTPAPPPLPLPARGRPRPRHGPGRKCVGSSGSGSVGGADGGGGSGGGGGGAGLLRGSRWGEAAAGGPGPARSRFPRRPRLSALCSRAPRARRTRHGPARRRRRRSGSGGCASSASST